MMIYFRVRIRLGTRKDPLTRILNSLQLPNPQFLQTLKMVYITPNSRRPVCPSCSKPILFCLCSRLQNPGLENSVGVIILQHSLERKHPLNSARIAKLGLKNVNIVTVSDINFEARFTIRLQEPNSEVPSFCNAVNSIFFDQLISNKESQRRELEEFSSCAKFSLENDFILNDSNEEFSFRHGNGTIQKPQIQVENPDSIPNTGLLVSNAINSELREGGAEISLLKSDTSEASQELDEGAVITATIGKYGILNSFEHIWMQQTSFQKLNIDEILTSPAIRGSLAKGFIVKKVQKRPLNGSKELEEYAEFEIEIPPKSVLLFPSENAFNVHGLDARDFDVKCLIVLDGTWAKAKRMYNENPWLRLLPHLKLDLDKMSLYSDVRHQPKICFLSTIESIVYALKAVGDCPEGLDSLLDVFESMIGDQRRCKDERLKSTIESELSLPTQNG